MRCRSVLLPLLALCALPACDHETAFAPTRADHIPELTLMGSALQDHFAFAGHWWQSTVLEAPTGATRVGVFLELDPDGALPVLEARGLDAMGAVGDWERIEFTWSEGSLHVGRADLGIDAFGAELRASSIASLRSLTWSAVVPVPAVDSDVAAMEHALRPELADIVVDRPSWGARPTGCSTRNTDKTRMAIHHTVTPATGDTPARMRGIQAYHMDSNGWCDIGYHFLIGLDGTIYEGRDLDLLGAHVGGHNTGNVGVSLIGCFHSSGCSDWTPFEPPEVMLDSAATMVGRITDLYDINIDATTVKGHRDHAGASTSCPGDNLHARLDDIRSRAGGIVGPGVAYRASWVSQSFPLASEPFELDPGAEQLGYIELRNDGTATWIAGETFLGTTEPRDVASALVAGDWVSPSRAATVDRTVAPGETGRFEFTVRAPFVAGDYAQFFNLVQGGVWFSDPGQGGPPDDQLQVRVTVALNGDAGSPDASVPVDAGGPSDVGPDARRDTGDVSSGCGCRTESGNAPWFFSMLILLALRPRRRARS